MFKQRSDPDQNILHFVFEGEVTRTELAGHRRLAILAARDLERPFAVVSDVSNCEILSHAAVKEIQETVSHLVPFGLACELRLHSDETPHEPIERLDDALSGFDIDVVPVSSLETLEDELDDCLRNTPF